MSDKELLQIQKEERARQEALRRQYEERQAESRRRKEAKERRFRIFATGGGIALALLIAAAGAFTVINTGERGVVLRMGKLDRIMNEGLNVKTPFIESVTKISVRDVNYPIQTEVSSRDMQTIKIKASLIYSVDPTKVGTVYQTYGQNYQDTLIKPTLLEVINAVIANYNIEDFVEKRSEISAKISKDFITRVASCGIVTKSLLITEHDFSNEFDKSIEAKKIAEQGALKAKFDLERVKLEAEAQRQKQNSLSDLIIREKAIDKWDGKLPQYYSGDKLPFIVK